MLGGGNTVAIENVHGVAGNRLWESAADLLDQRLQLLGGVSDESGGHGGLDGLNQE